MKVYKNKWFQRFARRERVSDAQLCAAVRRAEFGLIDADLGGGLIKQRVARTGGGKSSGYRALVFFRTAERSVFAFAFAKSDQGNLDKDDEAVLKKAARITLALTGDEIDELVRVGTLIEVRYHDETDETDVSR